jgi:hypothetical protein
LACNVKFKGLYQPYTNISNPPNMPNYGLGKIPNSPCDTIKPPGIQVSEIKIYPNPVSDKLTLNFRLAHKMQRYPFIICLGKGNICHHTTKYSTTK